MEDQAQNMIDATTAAFKAGKMGASTGTKGAAIPPPHMGKGGIGRSRMSTTHE